MCEPHQNLHIGVNAEQAFFDIESYKDTHFITAVLAFVSLQLSGVSMCTSMQACECFFMTSFVLFCFSLNLNLSILIRIAVK